MKKLWVSRSQDETAIRFGAANLLEVYEYILDNNWRDEMLKLLGRFESVSPRLEGLYTLKVVDGRSNFTYPTMAEIVDYCKTSAYRAELLKQLGGVGFAAVSSELGGIYVVTIVNGHSTFVAPSVAEVADYCVKQLDQNALLEALGVAPKLRVLESRVVELAEQNKKLRAELSGARTSEDARIAPLQAAVARLNSRNDKLQVENAKLRAELSGARMSENVKSWEREKEKLGLEVKLQAIEAVVLGENVSMMSPDRSRTSIEVKGRR